MDNKKRNKKTVADTVCRVHKFGGYTLISESGTSLKASGFINEGKASGMNWTGNRNKKQNIPHEFKNRWGKYLR